MQPTKTWTPSSAARWRTGTWPGLSLAVARGEHVLKHTAYGTLALGAPAPFTTGTRLPVLSVTKSFTGTAVMMLLEEGKLTLDDRIADRVPGLPALWRDVTVRQCLSHTSGYEDFIGRRVLAPAHLTSTGFIPRDTPLERRAHGHTFRGEELAAAPPSFIQSVNVSGGGLESTTGDLLAWVNALASGRLVRRSSVTLMWSPAPLKNGTVVNNYGVGWWLGQTQGKRWVAGFGGPGVGFFTSMTHFPDQQLTIVVITNSDSGAGRTIAREVANRYLVSAEWS